jgi:iron complex outermembrane receptor protein
MTRFRAPPARLIALAWALSMPMPSYADSNADAGADAADADPQAPILVVGRRDAPLTPSTQEGVDAARLAETTQVINAEDSLRYMPSLLVRKRHIGDTQAPLATRTSGVGASARSLIYADGVLLSALIGNNNSNASPRWGMVSPEEIARVDVLYGPFSAAYPGNSIGAVVNITTRRPGKSEASLSAATSLQSYGEYGAKGVYPARQVAATAGNAFGPLSAFLSANHVSSQGQPLAYATIAQPAVASPTGTPVTGAVAGLNRAGAPIFILGETGIETQRQDNLKAKLSLRLGADMRLTYVGGLFLNHSSADARNWLSPSLFAGALNIGGKLVNLPVSAFSNNVYTLDERHWMHALTAEGGATGGLEWRAVASLYDYDKDVQRVPSIALPAARDGGPGSILKLDGTGWRTLDVEARRGGLAAGVHYDRFRLASHRYSTLDWRQGTDGALNQAAGGRTQTFAGWAEGRFDFGRTWRLTLGGRYEAWRADNGFNFSLSPALSVAQPRLSRDGLSPKASLRWQPSDSWTITASAGQAYRFPTVTELYQAVSTGPVLTVPDPRLAPERARSEELAVQWSHGKGRLRLSLFNEAIRNALISQTAALVPGSSNLFAFVQNIPQVRTRGAELVFERRDFLLTGLELSGSATFVDPKVRSDPAFPAAEGKDLPQVPRRRATLVATWHQSEAASLTLAARYSSRSFATIDNSDPIGHAYQGFEHYLVVDARILFRISPHWQAAIGVENIGNERYFLFHPFPQRTFTGELTWRL